MRFTISFFLIGLLVFTSMATFDYGSYSEQWGRIYAMWDKIGYCLMAYLICYPQGQRKAFKPILYFMLVRLLWDCISWVTGLSINNTRIVGVLFLIYATIIFYQSITETTTGDRN